MTVGEAMRRRIVQLCEEHDISFNKLGNISGVTQSTIKKLCDGLGITLGEFFSTPEFDALEQEIK